MVKEAVEQVEQSTLSKAVKNVKQKLLTKEKKPEVEKPTEIPSAKPDRIHPNRGVIYLGHIPHGFFEQQMQDYFKQFGRVTRVRLVRSKKTGRSRGYGYVEFVHCEVAKIAAESMNNYLMCGRLLKATYIPPEKQHGRYFIGRQWSKQNYPRLMNRAHQNSQKNKNVDNKVEASLVESRLSKISNIEKKLEAVGIVYKINPVEVPAPVVKKRKAVPKPPAEDIKKRKVVAKDSTVEDIKPRKVVAKDSTAEDIKKRKVVAKDSSTAEDIKPKKIVSRDSTAEKVKKENASVKKPVKKIQKKESGDGVVVKKLKKEIKSKKTLKVGGNSDAKLVKKKSLRK